jgi:hypothetical protein
MFLKGTDIAGELVNTDRSAEGTNKSPRFNAELLLLEHVFHSPGEHTGEMKRKFTEKCLGTEARRGNIARAVS